MSVTLNELARGGFSAYGDARYDERDERAYIRIGLGASRGVTVVFDGDVDSATLESVCGLTIEDDPDVDGASVAFLLNNATGSGSFELVANKNGGEVSRLKFVVGCAPHDCTWGV